MSDTVVGRTYGPPGTGKTTYLSERLRALVREVDRERLRVASFSTTAAAEIANRDGVRGLLPKGAIGTLHSHAYRSIETPDVALDPKVVAEWNDRCGTDWRISGDSRKLNDRGIGGGGDELRTGDDLLSKLGLLRAGQVHASTWPLPVQRFAREWTAWKRERGCVDYEDMIVQAYHRAAAGEPMPGNPSVLILDEAQDMTPIECSLALAWGRMLGGEDETGRLLIALDDDQAIFDFRGGDPAQILAVPAHDKVLEQSHRVPAAVHAVATAWIEQSSSRVPKSYRPRERKERDRDDRHTYGWAYRAGYGLGDVRLVEAVEEDISNGYSVMVLASCGYMLHSTVSALRAKGIPFHNPYRPGEAAWNPMGKPAVGMSTAERIYRFLVLDERAVGTDWARLWTGDDVRAWAGLISFKEAMMARGAARAIEALAAGEVPYENIAALFRDGPEGLESLRRATADHDDERDHLEWLASVVAGSKAKATAYPLQVARSQGARALAETPLVTVGTIHSAKGGEADVVYLAPDLSAAGMRQWQGDPVTRDQTRRLMYVGVTRAFQRLVVLSPAAGSATAVNPASIVPAHLEVRP